MVLFFWKLTLVPVLLVQMAERILERLARVGQIQIQWKFAAGLVAVVAQQLSTLVGHIPQRHLLKCQQLLAAPLVVGVG
jgi:hypothetical protein